MNPPVGLENVLLVYSVGDMRVDCHENRCGSPATCKVEGSRVDLPLDEKMKPRDLVTDISPFVFQKEKQ